MTVYVQKANMVYEIDPDSVDYWLKRGFDVIDKSGKVLERALPNDLGVLQKAYVTNQARIKELEEEVARLKAEVEKPKKSKKQ